MKNRLITLSLLMLTNIMLVAQNNEKIIADSLRKNGQLTDAIEMYKKAITQDSSNINNYLTLADVYIKQFKYDKALNLLQIAQKIDSNNVSLLQNIETTYYKLTMYDKALIYSNKLIDKNVNTNYYLTHKALILKSIGERKASLNILKEIIKHDSTNVYLLNQTAMLYLKLGMVDSAFFTLYKSYNIKPLFYNIYNIANIFFEDKEYGKALQFLAKNIVKPTIEKQKQGLALKYLATNYIKEFENNKIIKRLYGRVLFANDEKELALEVFQNLINTDDSSKLTIKYLGISSWSLGKYEEVEKIFRHYITKDSTDSYAYYFLGHACLKNKKYRDSEKFLIKSKKLIMPDSSTLRKIYKYLASGYEKNKEYRKAIKYYKKAVNLSKKKEETLFNIAQIYEFKLNEKTKALETYKQIIQNNENKKNLKEIDNTGSNFYEMSLFRIKSIEEELFWKKTDD